MAPRIERAWLERVRVPTLLLNARNDPFLPEHELLAAPQTPLDRCARISAQLAATPDSSPARSRQA